MGEPEERFCTHYSNGKCKNHTESVKCGYTYYSRFAKCNGVCPDYEEDGDKLTKYFKCPRCSHFHVEYPAWGSVTYCDRKGYWEHQDWQKEHCKFFTPKTEKI